MNCNCLNPKFVVNPALFDLLAIHDNYVFNGELRHNIFGKYIYIHHDYLRTFYRELPRLNRDNIDQYYIYDHFGHHYPIFIMSPCGCCPLCIDNKISGYSQRLLMESQCHKHAPWFITLTYDNAHLPCNGVSVRDCQLFLKRFRKQLSIYFPNSKLRYYLCSEYGGTTYRPHYHAILFGLSSIPLHYSKICSLLQSSWANGEVRRPRIIDMRNTSCFSYTSKYLFKHSNIPPGFNPTFSLSSRRGGGIGAAFIRKHALEMSSLVSPSFSFVDKFTGKVHPFFFNRYTLDKLLPSFSSSIPCKLRNAAKHFSLLSSRFYDRLPVVIRDLYHSLQSIPQLPLPYVKQRLPKHRLCFSCILSYFNILIPHIIKLLSYDFNSILATHYKRLELLSKISTSVVPVPNDALFIRHQFLRSKLNHRLTSKPLHYA